MLLLYPVGSCKFTAISCKFGTAHAEDVHKARALGADGGAKGPELRRCGDGEMTPPDDVHKARALAPMVERRGRIRAGWMTRRRLE